MGSLLRTLFSRRPSTLVALAALAACGGKTGDPGIDNPPENLAAPPRSDDAPVPPASAPNLPETIAADIGEPSAIALDGERALFTTRRTIVEGQLTTAGALFAKDKRVGAALLIALDREGGTYETLTTDGVSAFVATGDARIIRVPLMGGDDELLAKIPEAAISIATRGDYVYFACESGKVGRVLKAGGAPEDLGAATGAVRGITADDDAVYLASAQGGIVRIALATKAATPLAPSAGEPCAMVGDGTRLFWTARKPEGDGAVLRIPVLGGEVTTVASGSFAACAIAADSGNLYFATSAPGTAPGSMSVRTSDSSAGLGLMRAAIAGGEPIPVTGARGALAQPGSVAVDATHIYWLTATAVLRLRK